MARLMKFDAGLPLENLDLLEPLTLKGTDDVFNMERLEVLGRLSPKSHGNRGYLYMERLEVLGRLNPQSNGYRG